jgi:WhiB family redox-sensing transcriptional regulator
MSGKRLTPEQRQVLRDLLREGLPYDEIAGTFGITPSAVTYHATRMGLARGGRAQTRQPAKRRTLDEQEPTRRNPHHKAASSGVGIQAPGPWVRDALCAQTDPEEFFPEKGGRSRVAIAICVECPVRRACLDYGLSHNEYGVWGGTSETERRQIRAQRRNAA